MARIGTQLEADEQVLASEGIYDPSRKDELRDTLDRQAKGRKQLDDLEAEWLQLQEDIDAIAAAFLRLPLAQSLQQVAASHNSCKEICMHM